LPVFATLRPTIARSHTLSQPPENPSGFSEYALSSLLKLNPIQLKYNKLKENIEKLEMALVKC
jgi:hypothetical protein